MGRRFLKDERGEVWQMIPAGVFTDEISQDFEEAVRFAVKNDITNYAAYKVRTLAV